MLQWAIMRQLVLSLLLTVFFTSVPLSAYSYWIWTPKTGKWVNPKTAVKPNPKEQFALAKSLFDVADYPQATREFHQLIEHYPKSFEASESQYYLGRIHEAQDNLYEAFLAYQRVIDKYPFSERIQELIERQFKIGEAFVEGKKRKAMGVTLLVENPAVEIFTKVVENSTYGPRAAAAQYKLGLLLKGLMRYYEAEEAFNKVIANYPHSEWVAPSHYQLAACRAAMSHGPEYDQGAAKEAEKKFETFIQEHPEAELSQEARKNVDALRLAEAKSKFDIGRFYEKQQADEAARIYYQDVVDNYSASPWAAKATERLEEMGKEPTKRAQ